MVAGLRNPGPRYEGTRHNVGGAAVIRFVATLDTPFKRARQGIRSDVAEASLAGVRVVFAVPTTFMNESGQAVAPLMRYYGVTPDRLLVVHDDIDLPFAKLKMQLGRGHGGNNGVRSVIGSLKTNDFWRLRIGVGRPQGSQDPADFVLRRFAASERADIDVSIARAGDVIERFVTAGGENARQFAGELND